VVDRVSTVTVTVCGCAGTHVGAGRACSSYLLTAGEHRLVLDLGNGSLANLQRVCDVADLDAVVLSHQHPDHFADVYSLYYALRFHPAGERTVRGYAPAGTTEFVTQLLTTDSTEKFREVVALEDAAAGAELTVGAMRLRLFAARHPVETLAVRVEVGDVVVAYSADSAPAASLEECARDADLFICDASWLERQRPLPEGIHMTGLEAGRTAAAAGAARLLVTHVVPSVDPVEVAAEAATAYGGEILVARDLQEIRL
jgi:ribonuclease BN (tRNA processing enzyme)